MKLKLIIVIFISSLIVISTMGCIESNKSNVSNEPEESYYMVHFWLCNDYVYLTINMTLIIDNVTKITEEIEPCSDGIVGHRIYDTNLSEGNHNIEIFVHEINLSGIKNVNIDKELWISIVPHDEILFYIDDSEPILI